MRQISRSPPLLVDRDFGIDVVAARRGQPDFDHEREWIGKNRQVEVIAKRIAKAHRDHQEIGDQDGVRGLTDAALVDADLVLLRVELVLQSIARRAAIRP